MNKIRYREHIWHVREDYKLIWDSNEGSLTEAVKKAIKQCSKFKIAMLDSEDIWNIHPVDLPMYYSTEGKFILKTVMDAYPVFFREASILMVVKQKCPDFFKEQHKDILLFKCNKFISFYSLSSDGTYYNSFDIPRGTKQKYKRLKIYVDRIND